MFTPAAPQALSLTELIIVLVSCPRWLIICGFPYVTNYFEWLYVLTASSFRAIVNNICIVESKL